MVNDMVFTLARAAMELDHFTQGKENDFKAINEVAGLIEENIPYLQRTDHIPFLNDTFGFPYFSLMDSIDKDFGSNIPNEVAPRLALEMKLFSSELIDVRELSVERIKNLVDTCVKFGNNIMSYENSWCGFRRYVA
jgi:hypothetical protein